MTVSKDRGFQELSSRPFKRAEGTAFRLFLDLKSKHHFYNGKKQCAFFLSQGLQGPLDGALF